jgi:outer membrane protein OmpA-like peptidoglycan-associated protein
MSKAFCIPLFLLCSFRLCAQTYSTAHPSTLGISLNLINYNSFSLLSSTDAIPGLGVSYLKGLTNRFDLRASLDAEFRKSMVKNSVYNLEFLQTRTEVSGRFRLFSSLKSVQPYFLTGLGVAQYKNALTPYLPVSAGVELRHKSMYISLEGGYRLGLKPELNHYAFSLTISGIVARPKRAKQKLSSIQEQPRAIFLDRDNDGMIDSLDYCPDVLGLFLLHGCPDSDGDGMPDYVDNCPSVFGYIKYKGCPVPDRDSDGVNDDEDRCPTVPGLKSNNGCPVIAKDMTQQINLAASNIFFVSGSFELLPYSFTALDNLTHILGENKSIQLTIEGHTDDVGNQKANQILSENRAKAVVYYLSKKGIETNRLTAIGYGSQKPIATNTTEGGRAKNRRVNIEVK